jgi:hypothetical protein
MTIRKITLDELRMQHFAKADVLDSFTDRFDRLHKLRSAMAYTSTHHDEVWIIALLSNGDAIEVESKIIDLEDDMVELQNGLTIPVHSVYDVGV